MANEVALVGGSGFIGHHLIHALANDRTSKVRTLVHRHEPGEGLAAPNLATSLGNLLDPDSLDALITAGCTVINLAYLSDRSHDENLAAATNLARACRAGKARRMVHVSTATVAGAASGDVITESTRSEPRLAYERTKLAVERRLVEEIENAFELVILRPTAVFGPGGRNLVTLAASLLADRGGSNYLRSCLQGRRRMNLVCVDNVVAAIRFAIGARLTDSAETFIVSDDDDRLNNYRDVEAVLRTKLGCGDYAVPPVSLPPVLLSLVLRLRRRSNSNPNRVYSNSRLMSAGFKKPTSLSAGLTAFADWYRRNYGPRPETSK